MGADAVTGRLFPDAATIGESCASDIDDLQAFISSLAAPHVIRGVIGDWPLVKRAAESQQALREYLERFYSGAPLIAYCAPASAQGRLGYTEDQTAFNFQRAQMKLGDFMQKIGELSGEADVPTLYVGSSMVGHWFPGLEDENELKPSSAGPIASLWLGNRSVVSAHFDVPDNVACCVTGRRRFTLLPPEQYENLYVGRWDMTPAGQPISLVDFRNPDLARFPRFARAQAAAMETVLEPGDAIFIPSMWWHHVEGLDDLNVLLNYWWRDTPSFLGSPVHVFKHALLSMRSLPVEQRKVWRDLFDYYVFEADEDALAHIPEPAQGIHGPMDGNRARALRAELLQILNR